MTCLNIVPPTNEENYILLKLPASVSVSYDGKTYGVYLGIVTFSSRSDLPVLNFDLIERMRTLAVRFVLESNDALQQYCMVLTPSKRCPLYHEKVLKSCPGGATAKPIFGSTTFHLRAIVGSSQDGSNETTVDHKFIDRIDGFFNGECVGKWLLHLLWFHPLPYYTHTNIHPHLLRHWRTCVRDRPLHAHTHIHTMAVNYCPRLDSPCSSTDYFISFLDLQPPTVVPTTDRTLPETTIPVTSAVTPKAAETEEVARTEEMEEDAASTKLITTQSSAGSNRNSIGVQCPHTNTTYQQNDFPIFHIKILALFYMYTQGLQTWITQLFHTSSASASQSCFFPSWCLLLAVFTRAGEVIYNINISIEIDRDIEASRDSKSTNSGNL